MQSPLLPDTSWGLISTSPPSQRRSLRFLEDPSRGAVPLAPTSALSACRTRIQGEGWEWGKHLPLASPRAYRWDFLNREKRRDENQDVRGQGGRPAGGEAARHSK